MGKYVLPYTSQKINEYLGKAGHLTFPIPIEDGGTGATTSMQARTNLGVAALSHNHNASDINNGILSVEHGGTGASTQSGVLTNLGITATTSELNYCDGVTSNIQTQLNGKAASSHNHAAGQITSGTLSVERGGTGQTSLKATRNAMGLGNTTGALPVANGGTGATTIAAARNTMGLGNTIGALPIANGGTGATTASAALTALGITGKKIKELWVNGSPGSSFHEQTVSIPEHSGEEIYVLYQNSTNTASPLLIGRGGVLRNFIATAQTRSYSVDGNSVRFQAPSDYDYSALIPLKIISVSSF